MKILYALIVISNVYGGFTTSRVATYENKHNCEVQAAYIKAAVKARAYGYGTAICIPTN